eukprot:12153001-Alexandrium_andersonii.AAC.1
MSASLVGSEMCIRDRCAGVCVCAYCSCATSRAISARVELGLGRLSGCSDVHGLRASTIATMTPESPVVVSD